MHQPTHPTHHFRGSLATCAIVPAAMLLAACSQTPKVPFADESTRRPANAPGAIDLQACRNELHNTRLLASESTRLAEASTAAMHQLALAKGAVAMPGVLHAAAPGTASSRAASTVYSLGFENNSTQLTVPDDAGKALIDEARGAALIVIRGRTDAASDAPMNAKAARERAEAARDWLTAGGIDAKRIRVTWQAFGDHVADNATAEGKALNRRVEIELYRALPTLMAVPARSGTTNHAAATGTAQPAATTAGRELQAVTTRAPTVTP